MRPADPIVAIATPPGRGAIGIVRLSGPDLTPISRALTGGVVLPPRQAVLSGFLDEDGTAIDRGLALYFPGPHSYTGEDVLELQGHGGPVVLTLLLARCVRLGARPAQPGEFTRRAFLNGQLDLAQAEAVADLIEAGSDAAARSAMRSLTGEFSSAINALLRQLIELRTLVEACIDFPEEDVDLLSARGGFERLARVRQQLHRVQSSARSGRLLNEGARVVLCGLPNVGKSTLMNQLAESDVAIVTDVPGTTRDVLREHVQLDGVPIQLLDTAGLRRTDDVVERLGVDRTWHSLKEADLAILLVDARSGITTADQAILDALPGGLSRIVVANKADLAPGVPVPGTELSIAARERVGLSELKGRILAALGWVPPEAGVFAARARHMDALGRTARHLDEAARQSTHLELFAEELRLAQDALGEVTGTFTADDLLGEIFGRFCIGK